MSGILFFDGQCGVCTRFRDFVVRIDRSEGLRSEPFQQAGTAERLGVTAERMLESSWWLDDDGRVYRGAEAINTALSEALGSRVPLWIYRMPGMRAGQEAVYRWVVAHRYRFRGATPYCESHPTAC